MKTKKYAQILAFLSIVCFISGFASDDEPLGHLSQISVSPGETATHIILESNSPLALLRSDYAKDRPSTILADFGNVDPDMTPRIAPSSSPLVSTIKVKRIEGNSIRLMVNLTERVPYRIRSEQNATILELNHIQRTPGKYILSPEAKKNLESSENRTAYLTGIRTIDNGNRIDIQAALTHKAVSNIFVLDNPLRLVVDLYNTYFSTSRSVHKINDLGVKQVRAAQFQISNPHTITRLVFDLSEPTYYDLKSSKNTLTISFFNENLEAAAPLPEEPDPPKSEASPSQ
ncbi:MAG: AMIN domain-containing protein, partial [Candidatus Aminicenantales bacterium]